MAFVIPGVSRDRECIPYREESNEVFHDSVAILPDGATAVKINPTGGLSLRNPARLAGPLLSGQHTFQGGVNFSRPERLLHKAGGLHTFGGDFPAAAHQH